jgi:acyl-CoA reductase-like NAD-dependent aldehyde dehydrogenase
MASASKTLKRVTLELGGRDLTIVCEDVDIEDVAPNVPDLTPLNHKSDKWGQVDNVLS